jgi:23S rRNA (pseudouridine1915-N3)-methyltransferase
MKHELLCLGKIKERFLAEGVAEYIGRLCHYTDFTLTMLKDRSKAATPGGVVEAEGLTLLRAVSPGALVVALDPGGRQMSTEVFTRLLGTWEMRGIKQVCYLIGGPDGHAREVIERADVLLSLSPMTFTHDMARLLLVEQLYRAYTIKAGEKYHK